MAGSGVLDLLSTPEVLESFRHLGYPDYFARILGVAKILGVLGLLAPHLPPFSQLRTLKEWAYAGFTFDLLAAAASHTAVGDPVADILAPLVVLAALAASYIAWRQL